MMNIFKHFFNNKFFGKLKKGIGRLDFCWKILTFVKLQPRLMFSFLILSIISLTFIGIMSYQKSKSIIDTKIKVYSEELMNQLSKNIDSEVEKLISTGDDYVFLDSVQKKLVGYEKLDSIDKFYVKDGIKNDIARTLSINSALLNFNIILPDNDVIRYADSYNIQEKDFKQMADESSENKGKSAFKFRELSGDENNKIVLSKAVISKQDSSVLGTFALVIEPKVFASKFNIKLDQTEILLLTEEGRVVYDRNEKNIGAGFDDKEVIKRIKEKKESWVDSFAVRKEKSLVTVAKMNKTNWYAIAITPYSYLEKEPNSIGMVIIIVSVICLVFIVIVSVLITTSVTRPLKNLIGVMGEAKKGNINVLALEEGRDEISEVKKHFNEMLKSICDLVLQTNKSVDKVFDNSNKVTDASSTTCISSQCIAKTMVETAEGTSKQVENITDSFQLMNLLSDKINMVEHNMSEVSTVVQTTKNLNDQALSTVGILKDKALGTSDVSKKISADINSLNDDMQDVGKIIKFIARIVGQTHLLALNASIEAAKAGEVGRGFNVVAKEIKKLAIQSKTGLKSISDIINSVKNKTQTTVLAANNASEMVEEQMDAVRVTDGVFNSIYSEMENILTKVDVVNSSMMEMLTTKDKTLSLIDNILSISEVTASITQEVSATTEEQLAQTEELSNLAKELNEVASNLKSSISRFKV